MILFDFIRGAIKRIVWLLKRIFFVRTYTVGIAVIIRNKQENTVLVVKKQWWLGGDYVIPGGGLEKGETFEDAAVREVEEETGIRLGKSDLGTRHFAVIDEWKDLVCTFIVDATQWPEEIKVSDSKEIKLAKWVPLNQIADTLAEEDFQLAKPFLR